MKKTKVVLVLMLALVMVLSACGKAGGGETENTKVAETSEDVEQVTGGGEDSEQVGETVDGESESTLDLSGTTISVQVETDWMDYYQAAADRVIAAYPGTNIEFKEVSSFDHLDVLDSTDALNEDVADLFAIPADRLYGLNDNMVLQPFGAPQLAEMIGGFDDFDAGLGGNFKIGEEYLAFPFNIETLITYTNTANAEASGIDPETTFEVSEQKDGATVLLPLFDTWFGVALTNSAGLEMLGLDESGAFYSDFTKDFSELTSEQQAAFTAIYDYWKLHNEAGSPLFDAEAGWGYIDEQFSTGGQGVVRLGGPWEQGSNSELAGEENLLIGPIGKITLAGQPLTHWKGGWGLAINARNEEDINKIILAEYMIAELVNPEYAVDLFNATGKILENVSADVYANSDLSDVQKAIIDATITSYEDAPARPLFTEWGGVWDTWKNGVLSWNTVKPESVEDAYAEIMASFEGLMTNIQ